MKYRKQHIIPEAYLKYFSTNSKVFVIQFNNTHRRNIQEKGIGDKIFCDYEDYYYNFPNINNEPILEKMFGRIESNDYETIMAGVESNSNLGFNIKDLLIKWLLMMKIRSSFFRDTFSKNISWAEKTITGLRTKTKLTEAEEKEINTKATRTAKTIQLSAFFDQYQETLKEYFVNFMYKNWLILKSDSSNFLTSDNPGFSASLSFENYLKGINPLSPIYNLDRNSNVIHYFPLSKKYCLCLQPILKRIDKQEVEELTQAKINIENVFSEKVDLINKMTIQTSHKLIIGIDNSYLAKWKDLIKENFI